MESFPKVNICGVSIDIVSRTEVLNKISQYISSRSPHYIVTPNVDHIVKFQTDNELQKIYDSAGMVLADGLPLLWLSRLFKNPIKEKISGSDLFWELCEYSINKGYSIFLLGGRPDAAKQSKAILKNMYPGICINGIYCPPFGFESDLNELMKIKSILQKNTPDILFVGLGAPKQEKWIYSNYKEIGIPVSIGVGVTFEFVSGMVKRAPKWMQSIGLEWFWRVLMEPKRLWKRYFVDDMKIFYYVFLQIIKKNRS